MTQTSGPVRIAVTVAISGTLLLCSSASAVQPKPGSRYLLPAHENRSLGLTQHEGALQVSDDGKRLITTPVWYSPVEYGISASYIEALLTCPHVGEVDNAIFMLGGAQHTAIPISSDGRFVVRVNADTSDTPDRAWVRLRGTFLARGRATVEIVGGRYMPTGHSGGCAIHRRVFHFHRRQTPPFPSCQAAPGRTIVQTATARVYKNSGVDEIGRARYAYACLFAGHQIALGRSSSDNDYGTLDQFDLAGDFVSFREDFHIEFAPDAELLHVVDLRQFGAAIREVDYPIPDEKESAYYPTFDASVVTPLGSLAWIAGYCTSDKGCDSPAVVFDVWIEDRAGARRVDTGQRIDPASLRVANDSTLEWTNGGASRSAPIDVQPIN